MNKTVLITGSLGFIGSHLSEFFLKKGFCVIGIDNLSNNYSKKVYKNNLNLLKHHKSFLFYKTDILNKKKISLITKRHKPDFLIHCAAKVGVRESINNPKLYNKVNITGTQILLEAIRLFSFKTKTIILSSSSVYGNNKTPFSENMKPKPLSPYGHSKYKMEITAKNYSEKYKLSIIIVRAFSVYGPGGRLDMLPFILFKKYFKHKPIKLYGSNEDNRRDWTYIDDVVDAISAIIRGGHRFNEYQIINVGSGHSVGIEDFINYFILKLSEYQNINLKIVKRPRQDIETSVTLADTKKIARMLKFKPKTFWKEGIDKTIKFFLKNKPLYFG